MYTAPIPPDNQCLQLKYGLRVLGIQKILGLVLIPLLLIIITVLVVLNMGTVYEPPFLLLVLNTLFIGVISIIIAYITSRVFMKRGSASVFLIGSGMLIFGIGSIASGWLNPLYGPNVSVTIHNTCACIGSIFILIGGVMSRSSQMPVNVRGRTRWVAAAYFGICVFVIILSLATIRGMIPPFFIPGLGPTGIRQVILENATLFFAMASILFMVTYRKRRSDFFFWYSVSLALISIGLFAVFIPIPVGSLVSWVGRSAQYLGGIFALYAVMISRREAIGKGLPLEHIIANFLADAEQSYKMLVETATDAIITIDSEYRILLWNPAAERLLGYTRGEALGLSFPELIIDDRGIEVIKNEDENILVPGMPSAAPKSVEIAGKRKNGTLFPCELTISLRWQEGKKIWTLILRDLTERKAAEEALQLTLSRLESAMAAGNIAWWEMDCTTGNITFSERKARMLGYPAEHFSHYSDFTKLIHPDDYESTMQVMHDHLSGLKKNYETDYRIHTIKGDYRWFHDTGGISAYDQDGVPLRVTGLAMDITDRKQADLALRESEEKFRQLFAHMPAAVAIYVPTLDGSDFIFKDFNTAAEAIEGIKKSDLVGKRVSEVFPGVTEFGLFEVLKRVCKTGVAEYYPAALYRDKRDPGTWRENWIYKLASGEIIAIYHDITDRKRMEDALRESEDRYRGLINGVPDYILVHRNGKILFVNPAAIEVIGRQKEDLVGSDIMNYIAPESRALVIAMVMKRAAGEVVPTYEITIITKGGEKRVTEVHGSLITFDGMPASLNVLSDVTERKQAEDMREHLLHDLSQKNAELERFTYTVSHDLKSPLITIKGFLGYLEKDALAGEAERLHDDIARIHTATSKMEEFIAALLELSRVGRFVNPPVQVPLALLVQDAVEALDAQICERGVTFTMPGDLPEVYGDRVRLQQVMTNLIGNAVKFMGDQEEPRIEIRAYQKEESVFVCIQDNGIGIAPENLDKIFSVFTRLDPSIPGSGIGLALVRRIIEVQGGECRVESEGAGMGSTFCFTLPCVPREGR